MERPLLGRRFQVNWAALAFHEGDVRLFHQESHLRVRMMRLSLRTALLGGSELDTLQACDLQFEDAALEFKEHQLPDREDLAVRAQGDQRGVRRHPFRVILKWSAAARFS